jgi:alkylation response protein AidB-like acyl-CoA dehydrogenase
MYFNLTPAQDAVQQKARQVAQEVKAMAKKFATDAAMVAAQEGLQILGGYGCRENYPLERLFRDARDGQIYEGTNEIMGLIIVRELLKGDGNS